MTACGYDVVVVGAGIAGAALACELARAGASVLIVDRGAPGDGSSGRNAGGVRTAFSEPLSTRLARRTIARIRSFRDDVGTDAGYHPVGYLFLSTRTATAELFAALARQGVLTPVPDPGGWVPGMRTDDLVAAHLDRDAGYVDPQALVSGFVDAARRAGARLSAYNAVMGIVRAGDRVTEVALADGTRVAPGTLVNAAGAWCGEVAALMDARLPMAPEVGQVTVVGGPGIPARDVPLTIDFDRDRTYFHRFGPELLGGTATHAAPSLTPLAPAQPHVTERLVGNLVERLPSLESAELRGGWSGWLDLTPDDHPLVGWHGAGNCYVMAGFSGHGLSLAPGVAEAAAREIAGTPGDEDLAAYRPGRFDAAQAPGRPQEAITLR